MTEQGTTMQALVLHAIGDLRVETRAKPQPGPGEALVRIGFCGVCGSDLPRVFSKGTYSFPLVCGHEFAGTIEALGDGPGAFAVGEQVAVFPLLWCGRCAACEQGRYVMCLDYDYLGSRRDGAFADYVVAPLRNLIKVPASVSLAGAAMTEPAAVALHALKRGGGVTIGETLAIFGAGPIGLMAAQWARAMGAGRVVLFDVREPALALARSLGFELAFDSRVQDPVSTLKALTHGVGADMCLEAAGVAPTMLAALGAARPAGRVVLMGNPAGDVSLPSTLLSQVLRRELSIYGTWNSDYSPTGNPDDWHATLGAMAAGQLLLEPLITLKVPLANGVEAFERLRAGSEFQCKVLLHPGVPGRSHEPILGNEETKA